MAQTLNYELTRADIRALAALIYEPMERIWIGPKWRCPQCMLLNGSDRSACECGITRDGLPEMCEGRDTPTHVHIDAGDVEWWSPASLVEATNTRHTRKAKCAA